MNVFGITIHLKQTQDQARTRGAGCSVAYDVFAVEDGVEVLIGSCYRIGLGPEPWSGRSEFEPHSALAGATRADCLWPVVEVFKDQHDPYRRLSPAPVQ